MDGAKADELKGLVMRALERRQELIERLAREDTDACRIFHGTVEGRPGLTVDRYGVQLMVQTFHAPLESGELDVIAECVAGALGFEPRVVWHDRRPGAARPAPAGRPVEGECRELGVRYYIRDEHRGLDPLLFLDFRAARRFMLAASRGLAVLNLFAYTCGIGVCAAVGGAREVCNVDFSQTHLDYGYQNACLNQVAPAVMEYIAEDVFPVVRQFAGLPLRRRGGRGYTRRRARRFDLVVLDPPSLARSAFGTVDLVRDYQALFKPALLATRPGGRLLCTNHVAAVGLDDWLECLRRCAAKAGRPLRALEVIRPEEDFPSPDGCHPLKMAVVDV